MSVGKQCILYILYCICFIQFIRHFFFSTLVSQRLVGCCTCTNILALSNLSISFFSEDIIKEQNKELRGTQRQITRDRTALEKQEKQLVGSMQTIKYKNYEEQKYVHSWHFFFCRFLHMASKPF